MTDFQKLMDKLPDFELTGRTFLNSVIYDSKFYKHKTLDVWVTDYDVTKGASGGGNLMELNKVYAFNQETNRGCMVSVEMMRMCSENQTIMQVIINQLK